MKICRLLSKLSFLFLAFPFLTPAQIQWNGSTASVSFGTTVNAASQWTYLQYSDCCYYTQQNPRWTSNNSAFNLTSYPSFVSPGSQLQLQVAFSAGGDGNQSGEIDLSYSGFGGSGDETVTYKIFVSGNGGTTGYINPKYVIVGVTYAPPGSSSNVTYSNSTLVGNTTTTTDTFQSDLNYTVSVSGDISAWSVIGGAGVKLTDTESTDYIQGSNSSHTTTISKQTTVADKTNGTGDAFNPVNHDYDTIWLWLNPLQLYSLDPNNPSNLQWNGYGYDKNDPSGSGGPDIYPVEVGWLNGDFGTNSSIQTVLARGWVTQYESVTWPTGEGPGLTSADIAQILQADLFTSGYTLPSPLPTTSADQRFTQMPFPPNPIAYQQAGPGNGGGLTTTYNTVNVNTSSVAAGASQGFKQAFGVDANFSGSGWLSGFTLDVKTSQTLSWMHTWEDTLTTTQTQTNALSVTGPGCPQNPPPCVPSYSGPGQFVVYQDNLFGTFMFYPSN